MHNECAKCIEKYLDQQPKIINKCMTNQIIEDYPIFFACNHHWVNNGWTTGNPEILRILLSKGANQNQKSKYGLNPLHNLFTHHDDYCVEKVKLLIEAGTKVNEKTDDGDVPLHFAITVTDLEVLTILLNSGADPVLENSDGVMPIEEARRHNYIECLRIMNGRRYLT